MNHALGRIFSDAKHHSHRGCRFLRHGAGSQPAAPAAVRCDRHRADRARLCEGPRRAAVGRFRGPPPTAAIGCAHRVSAAQRKAAVGWYPRMRWTLGSARRGMERAWTRRGAQAKTSTISDPCCAPSIGRRRPRPSCAITQSSSRRISSIAAWSRLHAHASRSSPLSKRFNSSRVLYMEMPVRSSPPRSARPNTCTVRAA